MAKKGKELKCSAYIDNGKISIIDEDGMNYQVEISKMSEKVKFLNKLFKGIIFVGGTIFLSGIANYFYEYLSGQQFTIFMIASGMSAIGCLFTFLESDEVKTKMDIWIAEFNLAKNKLQNELLMLEKELVKHEKEIEEIRQSQSLDFIQNFKKEQTNIPKTLLKEINS